MNEEPACKSDSSDSPFPDTAPSLFQLISYLTSFPHNR